ncbi:MAG: tetratricopeptide repeat protein [Geothrix sp.]|uniref:tetratricopeptide repeat protein n=1 Tax=Geothrix sp. TaxID=1962974 RepID=UPI003BAFE554
MDLQDLIKAGAANRKARQFRAAVDCYLRALALEPHHLQALKGLADAYRGVGDGKRCLETWDRFLALRPQVGSVQARVGDACRRLGLAERAAEHYHAALRHDPGDRHAWTGLGDLHQRERRPEAALACWERLLELDPRLLHIRTMAGNLCRKKLDFARAEHHFREALRQEADNVHAVFGLADALRGLGRFEEAAPYWDEMLKADGANKQVLCRAGDCYARLGNLTGAEALFRRALDQGYDRSALLGLARVHGLRGASADAVRCYEVILARNPGDSRTSQLLAQARAEAMAGGVES